MSTPLSISTIGERLRTQDNRMTQNPMFCLQILVRDTGFDSDYADGKVCWWNPERLECIYDDNPDFKEPEEEGWDQFGYRDRWETVMVAFTESGLKEYMDLDGHNVKRRAFRGQTRIYGESFNRCPEMIAVRELLKDEKPSKLPSESKDMRFICAMCKQPVPGPYTPFKERV